MAILTYGLVLASLAALVAGFFISTSSLPLLVSIGLSAAAAGLIVFGWGRRLREQRELDFAALDDESVVVELGDETTELPHLEPEAESEVPEPAPSAKPAKSKAKSKSKSKAKAKAKSTAAARPHSGSRKRVVVLPGRNRYHDPSCRFADHPDAERVTEGAAVKREAEPCSVCLPDRLSDGG